jgi:hypothetical protein
LCHPASCVVFDTHAKGEMPDRRIGGHAASELFSASGRRLRYRSMSGSSLRADQ